MHMMMVKVTEEFLFMKRNEGRLYSLLAHPKVTRKVGYLTNHNKGRKLTS